MTTPLLTAAEIAAIAERERKASPGAWTISISEDDETACVIVNSEKTGVIDGAYRGGLCDSMHFDDSAFIAHARTDIPRLLADRAELAERLRVAEEALSRVADMDAPS